MTYRPVTKAGEGAAREADTAALREALIAAGGNVQATGKALGIPVTSLDRRITALGLRAWLRETFPAPQGAELRALGHNRPEGPCALTKTG